MGNNTDVPDTTELRIRYAAALTLTVGLSQVRITLAFVMFSTPSFYLDLLPKVAYHRDWFLGELSLTFEISLDYTPLQVTDTEQSCENHSRYGILCVCGTFFVKSSKLTIPDVSPRTRAHSHWLLHAHVSTCVYVCCRCNSLKHTSVANVSLSHFILWLTKYIGKCWI